MTLSLGFKYSKWMDIVLESLSPVLVFTYNRLEQTKIVIEHLLNNKLSEHTILIVHSDYPKNKGHTESVKKVREYLKSLTGFKKIFYIFRDENLGVDNATIKTVSEVIDKHGKVIVLEDDIVTSEFFLEYMNNALNLYQKRSDVFGISAYNPPVFDNLSFSEDIYLNRRGTSWGWATWDDRWKEIDWDIRKYNNGDYDKKKFSLGGKDLPWVLYRAMEIEDSPYWDIRRDFNMFTLSKYFVFPKISLINNIGLDGSGEHCKKTQLFYNDISIVKKTPLLDLNVTYNESLQKSFSNYYSPSFFSLGVRRFLKLTGLYKLIIKLKG
ncbi:hypothetical protein ACEV8N_03660 [Vibrio parahaemolyticus]